MSCSRCKKEGLYVTLVYVKNWTPLAVVNPFSLADLSETVVEHLCRQCAMGEQRGGGGMSRNVRCPECHGDGGVLEVCGICNGTGLISTVDAIVENSGIVSCTHCEDGLIEKKCGRCAGFGCVIEETLSEKEREQLKEEEGR